MESITPGSNESIASSSPHTSGGPSPPFGHPPTPVTMADTPAMRTPMVPHFHETPPQAVFDEAAQQTFKFQRQLEESDDIIEIPESRERRMWELRLMHNFMLNQAQQFHEHKGRHAPQPAPTTSLPDAQKQTQENGAFLWGREIPYMAFEDDGMLYSMLAHSALNLWTKSTDMVERDTLRVLQQKYLGLALREQRKSVATLSRENADRVCMSSLTMLSHSFALVQTLPATPWEPPLEWLRMGKGAGALFTVARGYLGGSNQSDRFQRFLNSPPKFDPDEMFTPENREHLLWLLDNDGGSADDGGIEMQDKVTLMIYNRVLSYIGTIQKGIRENEPLFAICRRFAGFAVWMPDMYHEFLTQRRPRALVALAHFFALWIPYSDIWLVGKTGENQVRGIYEVLPSDWRHKLDPIFAEYNLDYDL